MIKKYLLAFLLISSLLSATLPAHAQSADDYSTTDKAIATHKRHIANNPRDVGAYNGLAAIYLRQGKLDEAADAVKQSLAIVPLAENYNLLGGIYGKQGKFDEAITSLRQAIALNPQLAGAHYNLGFALKKKKDYRAALDSFKAAYQLNPTDGAKTQIEACEKALAGN